LRAFSCFRLTIPLDPLFSTCRVLLILRLTRPCFLSYFHFLDIQSRKTIIVSILQRLESPN
jgi:hypothetical protein